MIILIIIISTIIDVTMQTKFHHKLAYQYTDFYNKRQNKEVWVITDKTTTAAAILILNICLPAMRINSNI